MNLLKNQLYSVSALSIFIGLGFILLNGQTWAVEVTATTNVNDQEIEKTKEDVARWDDFIPPRDSKFDWIQLTSGEWLKGELKVLYNYSLEFDSDELDLLKFDWEDIKQIRSAGPKSLRIENTNKDEEPIVVIGVLNLVDGKAVITVGDTRQEIDRARIISIAEGSTKESDLWTGKVSLGVNARRGNSNLTDASLIANAKRRTPTSRFIADYVGNFSKAEGVETSNNHRLGAHFDIYKTTRFFWRPIFAEYFRDTFKNIKNQVAAGTAFGYHIIRDPSTEWEVSAGIGVLYKEFVSVEVGEDSYITSPILAMGTRYDTDFTSWLEYLFDFSFQIVDEKSGTYMHHLITTLETDLTKDLDLDVSFVWDRVQDPQPAADGITPKQDDFQLIIGIGYEF